MLPLAKNGDRYTRHFCLFIGLFTDSMKSRYLEISESHFLIYWAVRILYTPYADWFLYAGDGMSR